MALSKPTVEVSEEELVCPICQELFTDPVVLSCGHTFCRDCLRDYYQRRPGPVTAVLDCPTCRKPKHLGANGVQGLPKNYIILGILEAHKTKEKVPCMACDGSPPREATRSCLKCELSFCIDCLEMRHPDKGAYADHPMVKARINLKPPPEPKCCEHGGRLEIFCKQCKVPVCLVCEKVGDHKDHEVQALQAAFKSEQTCVKEKYTTLRKTADDLKETISTLQTACTDKEADAQSRRTAINQAYERLIDALEKKRTTALKEIGVESVAFVDKTVARIGNLEHSQTVAHRCLQLMAEALKDTDALSFLQSALSLENRLDDEIQSAVKTHGENGPSREDGDTSRVDVLVPSGLMWKQTRDPEKTVSPTTNITVNGTLIECPELTLDAATTYETVRVQGDNKQLVNIKQINDQLFHGALVTQSFTRGMVYFETQVKYTEKKKLHDDNLVMSAGVTHSTRTDCLHIGGNEHCWGVIIAMHEGNLCYKSAHRRQYDVSVPVYPESDSYPPSGEVTVGYFLDCDRKRLTILDCTHDRLLYTHNNLNLTEPLTPAVRAHNHGWVDVTITLVTGEDITRLPKSIEQVI